MAVTAPASAAATADRHGSSSASRRVLITGASGGIGQALARALHAQGARLALCGRELQRLSQLSGELGGAAVLAGDLADELYLDTLIERAVQVLGGLDVLVNCAGVVSYAPVLSVTRAELRAQLQVNFHAPFVLTQRAAPYLAGAADGGVVVNVASTLGLKPAADTAAYAAAKAALISMTRSFALELGPRGIRVNAVAPGVIDTPMVRVARAATSPAASASATAAAAAAAASPWPRAPAAHVEAQLAELRDLHLLRRLGTPEEVADAVLYLIEARFVTGSVLVVDGGLLVRS